MTTAKKIIGWREWVSLPDLGVARVKAKVDTGARTSTLHAYFVETYHEEGVLMVKFGIHPKQKSMAIEQVCTARVKDERAVTDSGGHNELRYVIESTICLGERSWPAEITLTNRDTMGFRMLLGRTAMINCYLVDPAASYLEGKK
ncbi:ATP-dependent zinc protease [Sulfuriflexus sp.]|uniref:ATP-dependent zinc protease family protein n=1 Tax=Sulfuriflexus sp. TaxID=2015443 RepID=UPI0028CE00F9|nr:RimK/LysX family protein [Sulfuriflexus sp.]MDT8403707.1 RimK/LysX family protein [Sulfuriflexus sp.]